MRAFLLFESAAAVGLSAVPGFGRAAKGELGCNCCGGSSFQRKREAMKLVKSAAWVPEGAKWCHANPANSADNAGWSAHGTAKRGRTGAFALGLNIPNGFVEQTRAHSEERGEATAVSRMVERARVRRWPLTWPRRRSGSADGISPLLAPRLRLSAPGPKVNVVSGVGNFVE